MIPTLVMLLVAGDVFCLDLLKDTKGEKKTKNNVREEYDRLLCLLVFGKHLCMCGLRLIRD